MSKIRKRGAKVLAAVLSLGMLGSGMTVFAAPSTDGITVEVDLRQNGGILYDANQTASMLPAPSAVNALTVLPEKYDLRDEGKVTSVKFQNPWGSCWAFSALASLESSALMQGASETTDFSEKSITWFAKQQQKDEQATDAELEGPSIEEGDLNQGVYNMGGRSMDVTSSLASWIGASSEEQVPYRNAEGITESIIFEEGGDEVFYYSADGDWSVDASHAYDDAYRMAEAYSAAGPSSYLASGYPADTVWPEMFSSVIPTVKSWIMNNGAAMLTYCADTASPEDLENGVTTRYFNPETNAQYNPDVMAINHGVTVVGWDDTYSAENFLITPPGDGAWIIKNSWSDAWGDEGYFYLSYYDTTVYEFAQFIADAGNSAGYRMYDHNYQYDFMGNRSMINYSMEYKLLGSWTGKVSDVSTANVFQAQGQETLRAVGTTDSLASMISVEVQTEVYKLEDPSSPVSGELVSSQTDIVDNLNYAVIELDNPVELQEGEYFSVVQTMRAPAEDAFLIPIEFGSTSPLYVQGYDAESSYYLGQTVVCSEGQSFIRITENGASEGEWLDLAGEEAQEMFRIPIGDTGAEENYTVAGNAMIKAYTVDTDTTLSMSNETLTLICYDSDGREISRVESPDLSGEIEIPWNSAYVSFTLAEESASSLSVAAGGQTFAEGDRIPADVLNGTAAVLTLEGADRGEAASADYTVTLKAGEKPAVIPADKTALLEKLAEAKAISGEGYTEESYEALQNAIAAAQAAADSEEVSQEEVDAQTAALEAAIKGLVKEEKPAPGGGDDNSDTDTGNTDKNASTAGKNGGKSGGAVQTGDETSPAAAAAVLGVSAVLAAAAAVSMRRRRG